MIKTATFVVLVTAIAGINGCAFLKETADEVTAADVTRNIEAVEREMDSLRERQQRQNRERPPLRIHDGLFVGGATEILLPKTDRLPPLFAKPVTFVAANSTLKEITARMTAAFGVRFNVQDIEDFSESGGGGTGGGPGGGGAGMGGGDEPMVASIAHTGPLSDLLDTVADRFRMSWDFRGGAIRVYRWETKAFSVAILPGEIQTEIKVEDNASQSSGGGGLGGGGSGGSGDKKGQSVEVNSEFDPFEEIVEGVQGMLSAHGNVSASKATGMVTVTDRPTVLARVEEYIDRNNAAFARQVALDVKVYVVSKRADAGAGVNINAIYQDLAGKYQLALVGGGFPVNLTDIGAGSFTGAVLPDAGDVSNAWGKWAGSDVVFSVLRAHGDVSLVTSATGVTLNNQPMPVQNIQSTGYLASVSTTTTTDVGVTQGLTPGFVNTGFSMTVTPHILDKRTVMLSYAISLSSLDQLKTITSGEQTIQTPDTTSIKSIQRVAVRPGSTLILGGYAQVRDEKDSTINTGGAGRFGKKNRNLVVVTITVNDVTGVI